MSLLEVKNIGRKEDRGVVLQEISFTLQRFQRMAIAGATGSGKTSLLRIIAGLLAPTSGEIYFEGDRVKGPDERLIPGHPSIAYLSQHFELRHHYHVHELLEMNTRLPHMEVDRICQLCRIDHLPERWTHQLSGGEKQRVALALLLIQAPKLLLLDEPFSNLDTIHRRTLKKVIDDIGQQLQITTMLVAHDPADILAWADEIIILEKGRMIQQGPPEQVYFEPVSEHVAALLGSYSLLTPSLVSAFTAAGVDIQPDRRFLRPQHIKTRVSEDRGMEAIVQHSRFMGSFYEVALEAAGTLLIAHSPLPLKPGDAVFISLEL